MWQVWGNGIDGPGIFEEKNIGVMRGNTAEAGFWFAAVGNVTGTQEVAVQQLVETVRATTGGINAAQGDKEAETVIQKLTLGFCEAFGLIKLQSSQLPEQLRSMKNLTVLAPQPRAP